MTDNVTNSVSDDEEDETNSRIKYPELQGYLNKWTNYIHGWQKRWIILKDGSLSYYKSKNETGCGCRGAINLYKAYIKAHEFDPCRFDVSVNDNAWYLRADTAEETQRWLEALISSKQSVDSGYNSENNLIRHGSSVSLQSNTLSLGSSSTSLAFQKSTELKSKLIEIDTLKDSLCKQVDNIQHSVAKYLPDNANTKKSPLVEFKIDVMTCRATAHSISEILRSSIELISLQEDSFAKCLEEETEKILRMEEKYRRRATYKYSRTVSKELCTGNEDEFYDAVEPDLEMTGNKAAKVEEIETSDNNPHRSLLDEVDKITNEQIQYARMGLGKDAWQLFAEEGEMKMYKREEEVDGIAIDPLKACHYMHGFTAHEICNYFFDPDFRYEWETTLESKGMTVLERVNEDTLIFHQIHKRIWPTSQRDAVFWSHIREVPRDDSDNESVYDSWVVVNHSTDVKSHPPNTNKFVRIHLTVCLFCQTIILNKSKDFSELGRSDIACKITYCSVVNPGGWAPTLALRQIYKKEYPRFLRKFTAYVTNKTKGKPILF